MTTARRDVPLARTILLVIAVIVGLNILFLLARALFGRDTVDGPAGSSYVTTGQGAAALFELYERTGFQPSRQRVSVVREPLSSGDVYFQISPGVTAVDEEVTASIKEFVVNGGRLVLAGVVDDDYIGGIADEPVDWNVARVDGQATQIFPDMPAPGIGAIEAPIFGVFGDPGPWVPLYVRDDGEFVVLQRQVGLGDVVWVADGSYLTNASLNSASNAGFAVALADGRRPVFDEVVHGFAETGRRIPDSWTVAFWLGVGAVVAALISYGWRSGPPEEVERDLDPRRAEFVEAVGSLLARASDSPAAMQPIRRSAIRLLGMESSGSDDQVVAARRRGLTEQEARVLLVEGDPDPIEMGLAHAKLLEQTKETL